jgi:DNA-directed RNA polymerase specialized sigma24 family protein
MGAHNFSTLYQKLVFNLAYNFYGTTEEAEFIVWETYKKWLTIYPVAGDNPKSSLIRIAANLCMERGK